MHPRCVSFVVAVALALLTGLSGGCNKTEAQAQTPGPGGPGKAGPPGAPAVAVLAGEVAVRDVPVLIQAIGAAEAYMMVQVKPQIAGQIATVQFTEGQAVKKGDLLATLDPRPFEATLRHAEAMLARDAAMAKNAEIEAQRTAEMLKAGAAKQRESDEAQALLEAANATVRADQATIERDRLDVEYCTIRAPMDGRTGDRLADVGSILKANETPLVLIHQITPIYVTFAVPEVHFGAITQHMKEGKIKVRAEIPGAAAGPGAGGAAPGAAAPEEGVLAFVDNQIDRATGTVRLKATFENREQRLWPGQFVNVTVMLDTEKGVTVAPSAAVQPSLRGLYAYAIKEEKDADGQSVLKVEQRAVTVGRTVDGLVVIQSGLAAGERVVTDGHLKLVPGDRVAIKSAATQPATTPEAGPAPAAAPEKGGRP